MSWFASTSAPVDPNTPNFVPPPTTGPLNGALTAKDTSWACETSKGFVTETQSFYSALSDGSWIMLQVIFSVTGIMFVPPTVQFVFKRYDPKTKEVVWKSVNLTGWKPNGQSGKSDQVEIKHTGTPTTEEVYSINANLSKELQVSVTMTRPADAPGFKIGNGPEGGMSFFGSDPKKRDGFVVHRFLPVLISSGHIILNGKALPADGEAMMSHAIQGMRPNLVARRWNFAFFSAPGDKETGKGKIRAVQMEFETNEEHAVAGKGKGPDKVNLGGIVVDGKLVLVTSQHHATTPSTTSFPKSSTTSTCKHIDPKVDAFTGYSCPSRVRFDWSGPAEEGEGKAKASLETATGSGDVGVENLIEKVDVLAEIPYVLRKVVNVVAGTKPYIYQHFGDATLKLTLPGKDEQSIEGKFFDEITFISE